MFARFVQHSRRFAAAIDTAVGAALAVAIVIYQKAFSWMFWGSCRFVPSCSAYALEAVHRHGALRGAAMAAQRLARCHPFHPGGFDPVR